MKLNFWPFKKREPKPPVRMCECSNCHGSFPAPSWWNGKDAVTCGMCIVGLSAVAKVQAAERRQVDLIKQAIRELEQERKAS